MHVIMLLLDDIERDREERERKRAHSLSHLISIWPYLTLKLFTTAQSSPCVSFERKTSSSTLPDSFL